MVSPSGLQIGLGELLSLGLLTQHNHIALDDGCALGALTDFGSLRKSAPDDYTGNACCDAAHSDGIGMMVSDFAQSCQVRCGEAHQRSPLNLTIHRHLGSLNRRTLLGSCQQSACGPRCWRDGSDAGNQRVPMCRAEGRLHGETIRGSSPSTWPGAQGSRATLIRALVARRRPESLL
jgi:hypothetical protein